MLGPRRPWWQSRWCFVLGWAFVVVGLRVVSHDWKYFVGPAQLVNHDLTGGIGPFITAMHSMRLTGDVVLRRRPAPQRVDRRHRPPRRVVGGGRAVAERVDGRDLLSGGAVEVRRDAPSGSVVSTARPAASYCVVARFPSGSMDAVLRPAAS